MKESNMVAVSPRCLFGLVLLLPLLPVAAADPPDDKEIARLIKQLGDDDFARRQEAARRLERIGEPALEALDRARTSDDAEVSRRAAAIVKTIETRLYGPEWCLKG